MRGVCGEVRGGVRVRGGVLGGREGAWGVLGVRGACVGRVCWARKVGIARSALLSGYLGKSGPLPRFRITNAASSPRDGRSMHIIGIRRNFTATCLVIRVLLLVGTFVPQFL